MYKKNFSKIWSGNYQKEGYDSGIEDSKNNKPNLAGIKFFKATNPTNWFWNFNRAYDTFVKGYKDGYLDGDRVVNEIYSEKDDNMENLDEGYRLETGIENENVSNNQNTVGSIKEQTANELFNTLTQGDNMDTSNSNSNLQIVINTNQSISNQQVLAKMLAQSLWNTKKEIDYVIKRLKDDIQGINDLGLFREIVEKLAYKYYMDFLPKIKKLENGFLNDIKYIQNKEKELHNAEIKIKK